MFQQKQWLAVVRGNHWVVAKVARRKLKIDIICLYEFRFKPQSEIKSESNSKLLDGLNDFGENLLPQNEYLQEEKPSNSQRRADLLKTWLHKNRVPLKRLRVAVSCPGVITRMITLPLMSYKDLDKLLTEQVSQYFTLNITDYVVDYRVVDRLVEDGELRQRVLLAALPKYQWKTLWSEWEEIGFQPKVVDLAYDSLARLYSQLVFKGQSKENRVDSEAPLDLAIVELSADRVEFILLEQGVFFLYSDLEASLEELDQVAVTVNSKGLGTEQPEEVEELALQTAKLHAWAKTEVEATLGNVLQTLSEFLSFFATRHFGKSIDRIYLTGDYSDLPFIQEIFQSYLEVYTQVGFPNAWRPRFSQKVRMLQKNGMKYGSLYGLALREG